MKAVDDDLLELDDGPHASESMDKNYNEVIDSEDSENDEEDDEPVDTRHATTSRFSIEEQLPGLDLSSPALRDLLDDTPLKALVQSAGKDKEKAVKGRAADAWKDAGSFDWDADGA